MPKVQIWTPLAHVTPFPRWGQRDRVLSSSGEGKPTLRTRTSSWGPRHWRSEASGAVKSCRGDTR